MELAVTAVSERIQAMLLQELDKSYREMMEAMDNLKEAVIPYAAECVMHEARQKAMAILRGEIDPAPFIPPEDRFRFQPKKKRLAKKRAVVVGEEAASGDL